MRSLIIFLLCCSSATAQISLPSTDSSIIKYLDLPSTQPFDTARDYYWPASTFIYISSTNDLYIYFGYDIYMKFYNAKFNFEDNHILGELGSDKKWVWMMRDNKKAFREIPVVTSMGHTDPGLSRDHPHFFGDTVIRAVADTGISKWYTTGHGDCHAHFDYRLFADNYHPVLLLKEWNYWGGCRAGGSWEYTLSFSLPKGILYKFKNRILMDEYGKIR